MTGGGWDWDDPEIPDDELLYRKVLGREGHVTWDAENDCYRPGVAALSRDPHTGLSTHAGSLLELRGRRPETLYDSERYYTMNFRAAIPREVPTVGVIYVEAEVEHEPDEDLRFAHAEVRPENPGRNRPLWNRVRDNIIRNSSWVGEAPTDLPK